MKKLSVLWLLPLMIFGQPLHQYEVDPISVEFNVNIKMAFAFGDEAIAEESVTQDILLFVRFHEPLSNDAPKAKDSMYSTSTIPLYLTTISLSRLDVGNASDYGPQERLNRLLALNDPEFPKENTLFNNFSAIRHPELRLAGTERMQEWFGPKIIL